MTRSSAPPRSAGAPAGRSASRRRAAGWKRRSRLNAAVARAPPHPVRTHSHLAEVLCACCRRDPEDGMASDVTLVIITRDRREGLLRSLGRLEPGGPPVIVVDNGSSDGTA